MFVLSAAGPGSLHSRSVEPCTSDLTGFLALCRDTPSRKNKGFSSPIEEFFHPHSFFSSSVLHGVTQAQLQCLMVIEEGEFCHCAFWVKAAVSGSFSDLYFWCDMLQDELTSGDFLFFNPSQRNVKTTELYPTCVTKCFSVHVNLFLIFLMFNEWSKKSHIRHPVSLLVASSLLFSQAESLVIVVLYTQAWLTSTRPLAALLS